VVFACASAALLLFQVGYGFEVGDQLQYLLLPYREIYPDFLPGDWFTWQTSHYHATFSWIVRGLAAVFGAEHLAEAVFALHVLSLAAFGYALLSLSYGLGFGRFEALFALCGFALVRQMGLAGAVLNHGALVPADLALPAFLLACAAYARGARLAMGAWLGVAGFLHANYAVLGPAVLFPLELLRSRERRDLVMLGASAALFALLALPNLQLLVSAFLIRDPAPEAVAVTLFTRSPHHYDLRSLRPDEFYYAFGLGLLTLPRALGQAGAAATRGVYLRLSCALLGLIALGAAGSALHVVAISRLFTWRMSIALFAVWLLAAGCGIRELAAQRRWWQLLWALALCAGLTAFAQTDPLEQSPWTSLPRAAAWSGGLCALAAWFAQLRSPRMAAIGALLSGASALLALSVTHSPLWQGAAYKAPRGLHFLDGPIQIGAAKRPLYQAVREQLPPDARLLIPPGMNQFRMSARRSIFVDWKCAPMRGNEALEWRRRMLAAIGRDDFPAQGYQLPRAADGLYFARPLRELIELARREQLTHVLTLRSAGPSPAGARRVLQSGRYAIYELTP
jgi:hypothetical protein